MSVFILSKSPFHEPGGYAAYAYSLSKCLRSLGYDTHVVTLSSGSGIEETPVATVHSVSSKLSFLSTPAYALWGLYFAQYIDKIAEKEHMEKYIVHGIGPYGLGGAVLKKKYKRKVLLATSYFTTLGDEIFWIKRAATSRDYGMLNSLKYTLAYYVFNSSLFKWFEKFLLEECDAVIVHYDSSRKLLMRDYNVDASKIVKIPYCVDVYERRLEENSEKTSRSFLKKPLCVTVCRQDPRKGINYLLHALKIVLHECDINAVIVGGGPMLQKNKVLSRRLGIEKKVRFAGNVDSIYPFLQHADVFVLPTLQEGSGSIAILEALKMGIPVVSTTCSGGIDEDIRDGFSGILVPPEDSFSLAEAIQKVIHDKTFAEFLAKNSVKAYREKFSMEAMAKGIEKVYSSLRS